MTIDIRAEIICSLGEVISGNISDNYIQGNGLLRTQGNLVINGLVAPAQGSKITIGYARSGIARKIPRTLHVLSSFANPNSKTTTVELGCTFTYLADLSEPIDWAAFDDPTNANYTVEDSGIITLPISASSIATKCLTQLGIPFDTCSLTNKFSIASFDFSKGYVNILNDLYISESLFGFLDINGSFKEINLTESAGSGPLISSKDIIEIGPIGVGQLAGDAVTVSYSTLKLKQPENKPPGGGEAEEEWIRIIEQTRWESAQTIGNAATVVITYTNRITGNSVSNEHTYIPYSESTTTYETLKDVYDRPRFKREVARTIAPAILGNYCSARANAGYSYDAGEIEEETITNYYYYKQFGTEIEEVVTDKYSNLWRLAGSLNLTYVFGNQVVFLPSNINFHSERSVQRKETNGNFTRTISELYQLWNFTQEGQQASATANESFKTPIEVTDYIDKLMLGGLHYTDGSIQIDRTGPRPQELRPPVEDLTNGKNADGGDPYNGWRTESKSGLVLVTGNSSAQRVLQLSLPYAPDDVFCRVPDGYYISIASDAPVKANNFGRTQNKLLLGNRYGISVQLSAEKVPSNPFESIYIEFNGYTGLYKVNGTNWTFDSNGIICNIDALFWGGAGQDSG